MANQDEQLREIEEESAAIAEERLGYDPGRLANSLAGAATESIGESLADRYARIGARLLSDQMPSRLDSDLIDRLTRVGFDATRLRSIRVHRGLKAHAAADALGARAFAVGEGDIFFGRGEFDPSTRSGRAVIAHEVAHVAPPTGLSGPASAPANFSAGMGAPVLSERKRGDEDAAEDELHEQSAREAEAMVYAQEEENAPAPTLAERGGMPAGSKQLESPSSEISPYALEDKVMGILRKMETADKERRGRF